MESARRPSRRAFLRQALAAGAAGMIAGCGGNRGARDTGRQAAVSGGAEPSAVPSVSRGLTGTITVSYSDELGKKPAYVEQAAANVRRKHSGAAVTIDRQKMSEDVYYAGLLQRLATDDVPDVIHVNGERIGELADAGYIIPLDEYVVGWPDWKYYPPWVTAGVTYEGRVWGVPYGLDTRFLYFRRDVFERAGLPRDWQPRNVADVLATARTIENRGVMQNPYALYAGPAGGTGTAAHGFVPLVWAYGGDIQDANGRWIADSVAVRKAFAYYTEAFTVDRVVPPEILTLDKSWPVMRDRLGAGGLGLLFEGGWVYGGWAAKDPTGTEANVGYLLHPAEHEGPSFTVGGPGTCWFITAESAHKDLAWEFIATWNNVETVARLNLEDPHPVARIDAVRNPEYRKNQFLVYSTNSFEKARFISPDAGYGKVVSAIQTATARAAAGGISPEEAAARYAEDLTKALGPDKVTVKL